MCSLVGAVLAHMPSYGTYISNNYFQVMWTAAHIRGRDGRGYVIAEDDKPKRTAKSVARWTGDSDIQPKLSSTAERAIMIGNTRAEPTTEFVQHKRQEDQQPYSLNGWNVVHNGTIANDAELRDYQYPSKVDSAAIVEQLNSVPGESGADTFRNAVQKLKGSFAILAFHDAVPGQLHIACNYRPIWYLQTEHGFYFASSRAGLPKRFGCAPQMLPPYSIATCTALELQVEPLRPLNAKQGKALVVCSGGLDSVVSAAWAINSGYETELIHFQYGSRAEGPEGAAITKVASALCVPVTFFPLPVYKKGDSPLLDPDSKVAGGEAGAEFAYEWVPARNLLLLSVATAFAEAKGIETLVLGNNLEEAGAYPDNEPEFIERFNDLLPFAVGDGKRMSVIMPVGNMMKHEIVALGHKLRAPMHLTWSCYRAGALHCGKCGPCYMRRKAFDINKLSEVIEYERN